MAQFVPARLLRGPHAQSFFAAMGLRRIHVRRLSAGLLASSEDQIIDCGSNVRLLIHHTRPRDAGKRQVAVLIHGWEGSASSTYMLSVATQLWDAGYRVIRLNLRDHGDSHNLNEGIFHSCRLAETIGAVKWVQSTFPDEALSLGGISLGGNFSLRIAASAPQSGLRIQQVVAICPVLDPAQTIQALDLGLSAYRVYFMRKWKRSLKLKKAAFPGLYDFSNLEQFKTLRGMTDYFVRYYTEFPNLETYLEGYALTGDRLASLNVPATMLLAIDDPVIPIKGLTGIASSACLRIETSEFGGHCGFIEGYGLQSWSDRFLVNAFIASEQSSARVA
jgi:predicted alpha/beta-fold hydrolase